MTIRCSHQPGACDTSTVTATCKLAGCRASGHGGSGLLKSPPIVSKDIEHGSHDDTDPFLFQACSRAGTQEASRPAARVEEPRPGQGGQRRAGDPQGSGRTAAEQGGTRSAAGQAGAHRGPAAQAERGAEAGSPGGRRGARTGAGAGTQAEAHGRRTEDDARASGRDGRGRGGPGGTRRRRGRLGW